MEDIMHVTARIQRRAAARGLIALMLTLSATGCSSILGSDEDHPKEARVLVTGDSPVPLLLITTTDFVFDIDPNNGNRVPRAVSADTAVINLPVDQTYAFGNSDRFMVKVANPDVDQTANIRLRLLIDGREVFDDVISMRDAALQYTYVNP
jgi:hypothetical protein